MSRKLGSKLSEETKRKMVEGRAKARAEKLALGLPLRKSRMNRNDNQELPKPALLITGEEKDGFDFWPSIRNAMRPLHRYEECKRVEREVADPAVWRNVAICLRLLEKHFIIITPNEKSKSNSKPVKQRKKRSGFVLSEEHKQKMKEGRIKKREAKSVGKV